MADILSLVKSLDKGFYHTPAGNPPEGTPSSYGRLDALAKEAGVAPPGAELEARVKTFLGRYAIADRHSHAGQRIAAFAERTWALDHALDALGIRTTGPESHTTEKFFQTSVSTVLFPTYVESMVVAGLLLVSLAPHLVAAESQVNSHVCEHSSMSESQADRRTSKSGELARGTQVTIKTADKSINLQKYQAQLDASYESLRLIRLNVVNLFLQRMGQQIGLDETDDLLEVLISGDGNSGSGATITSVEVPGTVDYDELVRLFLAFPKGYEMRAAVINDTYLRVILNMTEFKEHFQGFHFQGTGNFPNPMGATWHRWTSTESSAFGTARTLALDPRLAVAQYTEGGMMTESDRLIDRQLESTVVSKWTGFGKLDYNATQVLDAAG